MRIVVRCRPGNPATSAPRQAIVVMFTGTGNDGKRTNTPRYRRSRTSAEQVWRVTAACRRAREPWQAGHRCGVGVSADGRPHRRHRRSVELQRQS